MPSTPPGAAPALPPRTGTAAKPFIRVDLERGPRDRLSEGRWANAVLYLFEHEGITWVVKDFVSRSFLVRQLIGRFLMRREAGGLARVSGLKGMPQGAFRVDSFALAYRFVPGRHLRGLRGMTLPPDFFPTLERNLHRMHALGRIAHFDLRNAKNLLVTDRGEPLLLDFQSHVGTRWMPGPLRRFAERVDLAAIYKHWDRYSPETLGPERAEALRRMNRIRPLWAVRGYIGSSRK
jgi:hypothetical protein